MLEEEEEENLLSLSGEREEKDGEGEREGVCVGECRGLMESYKLVKEGREKRAVDGE